MNYKNKQFLFFSFIFFSAYSHSNVNIEISRDSYLFNESKNSQLFKLNVILQDENGIIFKEKLNRNKKIFYKDLEEKQYSLIIEFQSYLKGKTENKYNLNLLDSGLYKVSLGKKNENFSSSLVQSEGKIYAYRINDLSFTHSNTGNKLENIRDNSETLKTALRNLTLLYEQEIITKQEYLERRQLIISKFSK
tara:strand:+ start:607 stop:1182 length:576 start_codon:yes stop_codon:yes gene_type:complete